MRYVYWPLNALYSICHIHTHIHTLIAEVLTAHQGELGGVNISLKDDMQTGGTGIWTNDLLTTDDPLYHLS